MEFLFGDGGKIYFAEPLVHLVNTCMVYWRMRAVFEMATQDSEVFETGDLLLLFVHGAQLLVGPLTHGLMALHATHRDLWLRKEVSVAIKTPGFVNPCLINSWIIGRNGD